MPAATLDHSAEYDLAYAYDQPGRAGYCLPQAAVYDAPMPNYVRWREQGAFFFFTVVTYRRRPLFGDADARKLLNRAFVHTRRTNPFDMAAKPLCCCVRAAARPSPLHLVAARM